MAQHRPILSETPCDPLPVERPAPRRLQFVAALGVSLVGAASLSTAVFQTVTGASTTVGLADDDRGSDNGWSWNVTDDGGAPVAAPPVAPPVITPTVADLDLRAAENPLDSGGKAVGAPAAWSPLAGVVAPVAAAEAPVAAPWRASPPAASAPVSAPEPTRTPSAPGPTSSPSQGPEPEPTPEPTETPTETPTPAPTPTGTPNEAPPTTRSGEAGVPVPGGEPTETPELTGAADPAV